MSKPSIELTSRCNNNCQMCPFRLDSNFKDLGDMDEDVFKGLVDELAPTAESIHIFNRGEATLHPKFYELAEYANSKCKIILSTNAIVLDVDRLLKIPGEKLLVISIPAGNRETYKEITGTDNFDLVVEKAKYIDSLEIPGLEFYVKIVSQPENEGQEEELKKMFKMVHVVEDSNNPNKHGYEDCGQSDITPVYRYDGKKVVCCRDVNGDYDFDKYYEQGKKRELPICASCGIR